MVKINYKSDFKINEKSETIALEVPFVFSYYVFDSKKYVVSFDGHNYVNCKRKEDGSLDIIFNNPNLGVGPLKVERKYAVDDKAFADGVFDVVTVDKTDVFITSGKTFETYIETLVVPPFLKGDKGDPMTWDTMTETERGELVHDVAEAIDPEMVMSENEKARQEAERSRQTAEQQRSSTFNTLKGEMQSAITAGNTAAGNAQKVVDNYDAKVAEQDSKLTELGSEVKKSRIEETDSSDFEVTDEEGNSIVKFSGGHVRTKEFNSEELNGLTLTEDSAYNFEITDKDGNPVMMIFNGFIYTKNFDGESVMKRLNDLDGENGKRIMFVGSSTTAGSSSNVGVDGESVESTPYYDWIASKDQSLQTIVCGVGGESAATELGRIGSVPYVVDGTCVIRSGESSDISIKSSWTFGEDKIRKTVNPLAKGGVNQINPCVIAGVECTIVRNTNGKYSVSSNKNLSKDVVLLDGDVIKTNLSSSSPNVIIFHTFGNEQNLAGQDERIYSNVDSIIDKIKSSAEFFNVNRYLVVGNHYGEDVERRKIQERALQDAFGALFINSREYISQKGIEHAINYGYIDGESGTYPTEKDTEASVNGNPPPTLMADVAHLNAVGHKILGDLIYDKLLKLKYI